MVEALVLDHRLVTMVEAEELSVSSVLHWTAILVARAEAKKSAAKRKKPLGGR